jgi:hypothetical protein
MEFFSWLQDTPFAHWVASDPSLLAYPTILTLHTVGMAIVVGTCVVMDLRLLGVAADGVPLGAFGSAPKLVWTGFLINAATGIALFTTDAEHKSTQTVFFVKLALIFLALAVYGRLNKVVFKRPAVFTAPITNEAKALAILSLILWTGATVAGRLMAYLL